MLKNPKLNIEYINSKTKKRHERDLTPSPKKTIKLPKAKQVKDKKYHKEGHRTSTQMYNILALN